MKKRLRIIQIVNVRWFNATAWYGLFLSRLLREAGHEVLVVGLEGTDSFRQAEEMGLEPRGLALNTVNPLAVPLLLREMAGLAGSFRPHVVNCHRGEGMLFWGLLRAGGLPFALVRTRGDQRPPGNNAANRLLHARVADAVIATNSRTAARCERLFGLGAERLALIPGAADGKRFYPDRQGGEAVRRRYGFAPEDQVVGLLGRCDPVKGHRELISALGRLRREDAVPGRVRLLLVGGAASLSEEDVRAMLSKAGLASSAVLTGRVEDVREHISAMDLGVIASQGSEAIARAAFEIMACGVPLIGTDVGVMPDLLSLDAMAPAGDDEALRGLLGRALNDDAFLNRLRAAQKQGLPRFSEAAFLEQTLTVYEQAMARRGIQ